MLPGGSANWSCLEAFFVLAFQMPERETRLNEKNRDWECVVGNPEVIQFMVDGMSNERSSQEVSLSGGRAAKLNLLQPSA
jgi:hypothetical protein